MNDIVRTKRLRTFLGFLAIMLPWIVVLLQLFNETFIWPASISATWYTNACTPFMIILGAVLKLKHWHKSYAWYQYSDIMTFFNMINRGV